MKLHLRYLITSFEEHHQETILVQVTCCENKPYENDEMTRKYKRNIFYI